MTKELRDYLIKTYASNYVHPESITDRDLKGLYPKDIAAYEAGYEVGRPKWHNVLKDPTDLPKENHFVFVYNARFGYSVARYAPFNEYYCKTWVTNDNTNIPPEKVFAWCETPKFEG